jgi:hypothetical protein
MYLHIMPVNIYPEMCIHSPTLPSWILGMKTTTVAMVVMYGPVDPKLLVVPAIAHAKTGGGLVAIRTASSQSKT